MSGLRSGMRRARIGVCVAAFVLVAPAAARGSEIVPGEVVVRFKQGVEPETRSRVRGGLGAGIEDALPLRGLQLLALPPGTAVADAVSELEREPAVLYAEPNLHRTLRVLPNDPLLGTLWGLAGIDAPGAWDTTTGSAQVTVAIGDSGIDLAHPDLVPNLDPRAADFVDGDGDPTDTAGHGTRVAGIVGARGNDGVGIAGVSWSVRLMALRIGDDTLTSAAAVRSFAYAAASGARIYNGSFGDATATRAELDAIDAAAGVLFVFAADNGAANSDSAGDYPCAYGSRNLICVGASGPDDRLSPFSNFGSSVDLAAPGQGVLSAIPGGGYAAGDGTSFAAPHVAGVAALYLARYPRATVAELRQAILGGVDVGPGFASLATGGRLNARRTLAIAPGAGAPGPVGAPTRPAGSAGPVPQGRPAERRSALSIARRQSLRSIRRRGLRARLACPGACAASARLELERRVARRLGMPRVLGTGSARLAGAGSVVVSVRLGHAARAGPRRLRGRRARLVVVVRRASGERVRLVRALVLGP